MAGRYRYVVGKTHNNVGVADLPDFVNFDEQPPRSFDMWSFTHNKMLRASTDNYVEITKEVADLIRSLDDVTIYASGDY
jgi:hypothetical protein